MGKNKSFKILRRGIWTLLFFSCGPSFGNDITPEQQAAVDKLANHYCADPSLNPKKTEAQAGCVSCGSGSAGTGLINISAIQKQAEAMSHSLNQQKAMRDEVVFLKAYGEGGEDSSMDLAEERRDNMRRRAELIETIANQKSQLKALQALPSKPEAQQALLDKMNQFSEAVDVLYQGGTELTKDQTALLKKGLNRLLERRKAKIISTEKLDDHDNLIDVVITHGNPDSIKEVQDALKNLTPDKISSLAGSSLWTEVIQMDGEVRDYISDMDYRKEQIRSLSDDLATYQAEKQKLDTALAPPPSTKKLNALGQEILQWKDVQNKNLDELEKVRNKFGAKACGLTPGEAKALSLFTESGFEILNGALRKDLTDEKYLAYEAVLNRALRKLNSYTGLVSRGEELSPEDLARYKTGVIIERKPFTSTSVGSGFSKTIHVVIHAKKRGHYIAAISNYPEEHEVLFESHTKFKVLSALPEDNPNEIVLDEVK